MKLQIEPTDQGLRVVGEIDLSNESELRTALTEAMRAKEPVILDFEGVTFMDSTGVHCLLEAAQSTNGDSPVVVLRPSGAVRSIIDLTVPGGLPGLEIRD